MNADMLQKPEVELFSSFTEIVIQPVLLAQRAAFIARMHHRLTFPRDATAPNQSSPVIFRP
jgi:hypothetical protein